MIHYSNNISVRRKGFILIHNSRNSSLWWGSRSGRRLKWLLSHHICRHAAQLRLSTCKAQDLSHTKWYCPWRTGLPTSTSIIKIIFHRHTPMPGSQVIQDSSLQLTLTIEGKSRQVSRYCIPVVAMVSEFISMPVGFDFLCSLCQSSGN